MTVQQIHRMSQEYSLCGIVFICHTQNQICMYIRCLYKHKYTVYVTRALCITEVFPHSCPVTNSMVGFVYLLFFCFTQNDNIFISFVVKWVSFFVFVFYWKCSIMEDIVYVFTKKTTHNNNRIEVVLSFTSILLIYTKHTNILTY